MDIRDQLFVQSPYSDFPLEQYPYDSQGWHSQSGIFKELIKELRPSFIIEVGSWKGGSSITMGKAVLELGLDCHILCIDTWLGALEFWREKNDPERYLALNLHYGYPRVYYQFLANVMHQKLSDIITPFPQTSLIAARWLKERGLKSKMIYIDASHDEMDVYGDLHEYWSVLEQGGVIFGDDYDQHWPGLVRAVNRFAEEKGTVAQKEGVFWILRKGAPFMEEIPPDTQEMLWQLLTIVCKANQPQVAIYGAGDLGRAAIRYLRFYGINVVCVVDSNAKIHGTEVEPGLICAQPEFLQRNREVPIVIASKAFSTEIKNHIHKLFAGASPPIYSL